MFSFAQTKSGIAAKYRGDKGIDKDPDVLVFTDFETMAPGHMVLVFAAFH